MHLSRQKKIGMPQNTAPDSFDAFQARLVEVTENSPKRLRQCADYVARNADKIAVSTVAEMSRAAGVQPSAFMRFCQLMGYSGYSQMQKMFRENYHRRWPDYTTRLEKLRASDDESPTALLAEFVEAGRSSLEMLAGSLDARSLETAVDKLCAASLIHLIGLSRAFPVAAYLSYTLEKMDVPAILHDRGGNLDHRHAIGPGDVLVAISFAPYTEETLELARFARDRNCDVVAITDALNSPLHGLGAIALTVSEADVGSFRALSAPLTLAISLAVAVGSRRNEQK